jgi:23S rRNA (pseudouridine1915-N3)-methyltransferase
MIRLLACGKLKEKWMRQGVEEYLQRIRPYDRIEEVEVADEPAPAANSPAQNEQVKRTEGQRLLRRIGDGEVVVLLDLAGEEMDSMALARFLEDCRSRGRSRIDFVIGGSLGVSPELIRRADVRWKLSASTFPHGLCRILVLEQVYRAFKIMAGEPYHK